MCVYIKINCSPPTRVTHALHTCIQSAYDWRDRHHECMYNLSWAYSQGLDMRYMCIVIDIVLAIIC